jgi:hypothetical protein
MPVEQRRQAIRVMIGLVNWQQEEPKGYGGGRQLPMDGTSRVTGDSHARICERLGVKIPGATRRPGTQAGNLAGDGCPRSSHAPPTASARRANTRAGHLATGADTYRLAYFDPVGPGSPFIVVSSAALILVTGGASLAGLAE